MSPEKPGEIANEKLICDVCGKLFITVESLKEHQEAEITDQEGGVGV